MKTKRCHFNSILANFFLTRNYIAITLFFNSFFKESRWDYFDSQINHEKIHQVQQLECTVLGLVVGLLLVIFFGLPWYMVLILGLGLFYLIYGVEYLAIHFSGYWKNQSQRYHDVSFEEEAHNNDENLDYLKDRKPFAWIKYIKIGSYKR